MTIAAILLLPEEGDPLGLLKYGPCGARPPRAVPRVNGQPSEGWAVFTWAPLNEPSALVLAWEGKRIRSGVFRAWDQADEVLYSEPDGLGDALEEGGLALLAGVVASWRRDEKPLGTIVLLDESGREVE